VTDLPSHFTVAFPTQICRRLNGKLVVETHDWATL